MSTKQPTKWLGLREMVLLGAGLLGIAIETGAWLVDGRTPDPSLLLTFTAMLGLPIMLNRDGR